MSQEDQITEINNKIPKDPRYQNVPKGQRYPKGTFRSKVPKRYLQVQGIQKVPKGPRYPKGT